MQSRGIDKPLSTKTQAAVSEATDSPESDRKGSPGVSLWGLVADHGLRTDSAQEAQHAMQQLAKMNIEAHLLPLTWPEGRPAQGHLLQTARASRYAALGRTCQELGCSVLLTGHHAGKEFIQLPWKRCNLICKSQPSHRMHVLQGMTLSNFSSVCQEAAGLKGSLAFQHPDC